MVSRWSFASTGKSLEDVLRRLKDVLRPSPGGRLDDVLEKVVVISILGQFKRSLRQNLDVFATSLHCLCVDWDIIVSICRNLSFYKL